MEKPAVESQPEVTQDPAPEQHPAVKAMTDASAPPAAPAVGSTDAPAAAAAVVAEEKPAPAVTKAEAVVAVASSPSRPVKDKKKSKFSNIFIAAAKPDEDPDAPSDRIRLGICAMDKKARSKPMGEILSRLDAKLFRVVFFGDHMILNQPVEEWPEVDVVIAFFSNGTLVVDSP
jgi:hypothetical protein